MTGDEIAGAILRSELPMFEVRDPNSNPVYQIFFNGTISGFPNNDHLMRFNFIKYLVLALQSKLTDQQV